MPSVWVDGFQVRVIPGDHEPAHVHAGKGGNGGPEAVFIIAGGLVELRENRGFKPAELRAAGEIVAAIVDVLLKMWEESQPK